MVHFRVNSVNPKGPLWVTSEGVVVACRTYDQVSWNSTNSASAEFFGFVTELTWHLAEKAVHEMKLSGKTVAS